MMFWLVKRCIKNNEAVAKPSVKKAYATLSRVVEIVLNLFLCTAKILIGFCSNSIAISADGFNNLADAGTAFVSLIGFRIAQYSGGEVHPFGHGRIEWIMSIGTSIAIMLMSVQLAVTSLAVIQNPQKPIFNLTVLVVLLLSILVKGYMYCYNCQFAKITDSAALKATAADSISDAVATFAVLVSAIFSHFTSWQVDGYCGLLVAGFIMLAGIKSLWEVLGRIMGKAAEQSTVDDIWARIKVHPEIQAVHNLMVHDYGFGYFVVSMRVEGYKKDSEQLYQSTHQIAYDLYQKYQCECLIQIDYLLENSALTADIQKQIEVLLQKYNGKVASHNLRLLENGSGISIVFDLVYPADLQKEEEAICFMLEDALKKESPRYHIMIKGMIRGERFSLHRFYKNSETRRI